MGIIKFGSKFQGRPVKSAGKKRQRVKAQKRRLIAAGMDAEVAAGLNIKETREALKLIARKKKKTTKKR